MKINKLILILMIGSINITNTTIPKVPRLLQQSIGLAGMVGGSYKIRKAFCAYRMQNNLSKQIFDKEYILGSIIFALGLACCLNLYKEKHNASARY